MHFDHGAEGRLLLREGDVVLAEYVYEPDEPQVESPRPYALLRTLNGRDVTAYRPDDHVWHKGLSLALPNVGPHNFWGGPTYVAGEGYVQLPNNGRQAHRSFVASDTPIADAAAGLARIDEDLDWITEPGETLLTERRTLTARRVGGDAWALTWRSALTNVSRDAAAFGSPTTKGRDDAGYAGIFWRGPSGFAGGAILRADGAAGDAARGEPAPWLAFVAPDESAGVVMLDAGPGAGEHPWFARSAGYAGLCPAPFFFDEAVLEPDATLVLAAAVIVDGPDVAALAPSVGANLVAELGAVPEDRISAEPGAVPEDRLSAELSAVPEARLSAERGAVPEGSPE
ncbi:PmoA family protein [Microbacterium sp. B2969]|uniref:PmoA family protein n=1 Tax=Microbacterium alkaliflavum TaxID=3248839 RepID=A0ABW7QAS9_9MICO